MISAQAEKLQIPHMVLLEQEKIKLAKSAFQRFLNKIQELARKQRILFEKILKRVEEREMAKTKEEIKKIISDKKSSI